MALRLTEKQYEDLLQQQAQATSQGKEYFVALRLTEKQYEDLLQQQATSLGKDYLAGREVYVARRGSDKSAPPEFEPELSTATNRILDEWLKVNEEADDKIYVPPKASDNFFSDYNIIRKWFPFLFITSNPVLLALYAWGLVMVCGLFVLGGMLFALGLGLLLHTFPYPLTWATLGVVFVIYTVYKIFSYPTV